MKSRINGWERIKGPVSWIACAILVSSLVLPACTITSTPILPTSTPESTPTPGPDWVQPPPGLWRDAVPPEAIETKRSVESAQIPQRDLIDVTMRLDDPGQPIPQVTRDQPWGFEIDDTYPFWVLNWDTKKYAQVTARLVYSTPHTYVFVEDGVKLDGGLLKRLADRFEARTYPTNREFFGEEWSPGVDNDPHLTLLFARHTGDAISGYQHSLDEYSRLVHPYSNQMEIIYLSADGVWLDDPASDCLLAHEFQHVIQWANDRDETVWMNEGFSVLACQLNGLLSTGIGEALEAFAEQPDTQLNSWNGKAGQALAQYGASYLFLVYFLDRFGEEALRALVAEQKNGLESVGEVLESLDADIGADDVFADWVAANTLNDPSLADGRYGYSSLVPPSFEPEVGYQARDLPVERQAEVRQYAADYILLRGQGSYQVDFAGATMVGLVPTSAHSGQYAWWGGRGANSDTTLTREFDLTGLEKATLTFYTWYDIESNYDYAYVEVSADGEHWTTLAGRTTTHNDPNGANYDNGYTGVSNGWTHEIIDLTPYVGQKVHIRFEYLTDDGPVRAGIFLDDIEIPEVGYRDDAESGDSGWAADGFFQVAPVLPQAWLVQSVTQRHDGTTVERLQLNPDNTTRWSVDLGVGESAALVVSGRTRVTIEPARYWYRITNKSE